MSDWFMVSAWFENGETEVHFEISNEDGEQYFFGAKSKMIIENIIKAGGNALERFRYAEEDMLGMAVTIIDEECLEAEDHYIISNRLFSLYYK
ncbi:MAG: hypothetical protein ACJA0E_000418 [Bermanella sp.]|jgi:hypothetical protein